MKIFNDFRYTLVTLHSVRLRASDRTTDAMKNKNDSVLCDIYASPNYGNVFKTALNCCAKNRKVSHDTNIMSRGKTTNRQLIRYDRPILTAWCDFIEQLLCNIKLAPNTCCFRCKKKKQIAASACDGFCYKDKYVTSPNILSFRTDGRGADVTILSLFEQRIDRYAIQMCFLVILYIYRTQFGRHFLCNFCVRNFT